MDFVVHVGKFPTAGETVLGSAFEMDPGGKGANQACAAGRLGGPSLQAKMIGRVGYDLFADHLKASLGADSVDVSGVHATRSEPTGVAFIWVDRAGQNSIVVAPGANNALSPRDVESLRPALMGASTALFQLETPLAFVEATLQLARSLGVRTILDPAPAQTLSPKFLGHVDILTPNETEACLLLSRPVVRIGMTEAPEIAGAIRSLGAHTVILKLGDQGCYYQDDREEWTAPAFKVDAIDTTAAGDTFNGALAVALAEGESIDRALRFANAASALSVTRRGAQLSVPKRSEVDAFLKSCAS
jgi:ribokinase